MLKISGVKKSFEDKKVLDNINIEIKDRCIIGLLGPNGAGKTTLMRIITGFYELEEGEIRWNDKKVDTKDKSYKKRVGYLPENNPLYFQMTTGEYLSYVAKLKGLNETDLKICLSEIAKSCDIEKVMGSKIEILSKGYKQRVGLAAALIGDPELLILDEPTSGLDPNQIIEVRGLIKKLAKKKVVIFSTHILPEAKELCDHLLIINKGRIVLNDETGKIKNLEKKFVELTV